MNDCPSKTYCVLPWMHQAFILDNHFRPCGRFKTKSFPRITKQSDIKTSIHSKEMSEIREQMLNNEWPDGCIRCKNDEAANAVSLRQRSNELFSEYIGMVNPKLHYLELCLSSDCNMTCIMCCRYASTKWNKLDIKLLNQTQDNKIKNEMEYYISSYPERSTYEIDLDVDFWKDIKYMKLQGGEPFIVKYNKKLIQFLYDENIIQQMTIKIVTNGSIRPTPEMWKQLNKCKKLEMVISVDGIGSAAEWLRPGARWSRIDDNIKFFISEVDTIQFHISVTSFNIKHMEKIYEYVDDLQIEIPRLITNTHVLDPNYTSILYLEDGIKEKIIDSINSEQLKKILHHSLNKYENLTSSMINYMNDLDKINGTSYKEMVPDNYEFLDSIGVFK